MKALYLLPLFALLSSCSMAQPLEQDLNGLWKDSTGNSFSDCHLIIAQKGDSVFMTHSLKFNGSPFVEYGSGVVKNDSVIYNVTISKGIEGWSTAGIHSLKLSTDGKTLRGKFEDNLGNVGGLVFKKQD